MRGFRVLAEFLHVLFSGFANGLDFLFLLGRQAELFQLREHAAMASATAFGVRQAWRETGARDRQE
jgi:hypothetical protein